MRVAVLQHSMTARPEQNLETSQAMLREAAAAGAQLALLPELHRSLYFCQQEDTRAFDLAEPVPGPTTEALGTLARELSMVIVGSVFEKRAAGLYHNTAVVLDRNGELAGSYRKMHIPDDPGYYEKFYFTPGDAHNRSGQSGFSTVETSLGRLGVLVCWDQWYPEAARLMALQGAELLLYPTAIGWDPRDDASERQRQHDAWETIQRSHAIANALPVLVANRTGHEPDPGGGPGTEFWGQSLVAGPQGEVLARASEGEDQLLLAELDPGRTDTLRRLWPFLRDRRVDAYEDLLKRFRD